MSIDQEQRGAEEAFTENDLDPTIEKGVMRARFIADKEAAEAAINDLVAAVDQAVADLDGGISLARRCGLTWQNIGDALGITRQGANLRFRRAIGSDAYMTEKEVERLEKLLGVRSGVVKWEVRYVAAGRIGISKITWEKVSGPHIKREVAERQLDRWNDDPNNAAAHPAYMFRIAPDGTTTRLGDDLADEKESSARLRMYAHLDQLGQQPERDESPF